MTVWSSHPIVFAWKHILSKICIALIFVVIITTILLVYFVNSTQAASRTISFSARLKNASGGVVADGYYNVSFRLYQQSTNGSHIWSETYNDTNGAESGDDYRVRVINGYLNVKLGSRQAFEQNVNWEDDLWLTMNIGGTSQIANPDNIAWDGEMSPRIQLTAVPYALSSGAVGGKTANDLTQLGQGKQTDSSANSSIFIDKTGSGNLIQLQASGQDIFTINNTGSITLGSSSSQSISVGQASDQNGGDLAISAGDGTNGGSLSLEAGDASQTDGNGGDVNIDAGAGNGAGQNGAISLGVLNATTITIGNSNSTTIVDGSLQIDTIDTASEAELLIGGENASSITLGQDTTLADGKTLSINGDTTIKSSQIDSASAFKVQNLAGADQLTINTLDSQISIGTVDDLATLLVIDSKNTTGDPAGVNGAMYYNSDDSKFRCYENGAWKDCITPLPVAKVAKTDTSNSTATPIDVDDMSFSLDANTKYYYKFVIIHDTDDEEAGIGFGVTLPNSPASSNWCANTSPTLGATANFWGAYCGAGDASSTTDGTIGLGTNFTTTIEGYLETAEEAGTLQLRMKSESTNKTTVKSGSFGVLQIVQ